VTVLFKFFGRLFLKAGKSKRQAEEENRACRFYLTLGERLKGIKYSTFVSFNICVLTHLMKCVMFGIGGDKHGKSRCRTREVEH
jgi:hypothetical protein